MTDKHEEERAKSARRKAKWLISFCSEHPIGECYRCPFSYPQQDIRSEYGCMIREPFKWIQ